MIGIIVLIDQLMWRPVIAWAEKFKFEQVESTGRAALAGSGFVAQLENLAVRRAADRAARARKLSLHFARSHAADGAGRAARPIFQWLTRLLLAAALAGIVYESAKMVMLLTHLTREELRSIFLGAGATFLRVAFTLFLAALWTIPVGVLIGLKPKLSAIAQPMAQVAASVPATALFPIILLVLIRAGGGLESVRSCCCCWERSGTSCST